MGINRRNEDRHWTEVDDRYLREFYPGYGRRGLELALGRSWRAIQSRASELKTRRRRVPSGTRRRLIGDQRQQIVDRLAQGMHPAEIALELCEPYFVICNIRSGVSGKTRVVRIREVSPKPNFWQRVKQKLLGQREVW